MEQTRVLNTIGKFASLLPQYNSICVSVSGGSDSDVIVHIIATHFREYLEKINFIFADTGIEYQATKDHLDYLEKRYKIKIERLRGTPIPIAVKKYGVPFISKKFSDSFQRLQKHGFKWEDEDFSTLYARYPRCKAALRFWCNDWGEKSRFNIEWVRYLKEFLIVAKPEIKFSSMCCNVSKKAPLEKYQKSVNCDLFITGERRSEGGARASAHTSCFEKPKNIGIAHFMPLFYWDDETKAEYKRSEGIKYSDCYEVYGLTRTGCVGCPFGQNLDYELSVMKEFEPKLYKLCWIIFGDSYKLRSEFSEFRKGIKANGKA